MSAALRGVVFTAGLLLSSLALVSPGRLTIEQIIQRHLSQGTAGAVLQAGHVRDLGGPVALTAPGDASRALAGRFEFTSAAASSRLVLRFGSERYDRESWSTDGRSVDIGFADPRTNSRSALGIFLWMNKVIVGEGLLGGVLNARWPLLDLHGRRARVSYEGLKTLGGRELHCLRYRAKQDQGPLEVLIFLDPGSYRHVATVYGMSQAPGMVQAPEDSHHQELVFRLEEWFSDPVRFGAVALPGAWTLRYERSGKTAGEWSYALGIEKLDEHALERTGARQTVRATGDQCVAVSSDCLAAASSAIRRRSSS